MTHDVIIRCFISLGIIDNPSYNVSFNVAGKYLHALECIACGYNSRTRSKTTYDVILIHISICKLIIRDVSVSRAI